ncbi:flagellar assembly protein FliW [Paenibacillus sp. CMAA1364]
MDNQSNIVIFPKGLPGFKMLKKYAIQQYDENFSYLISQDDSSVAFIIVNPFDFYPDYELDVPDDLLEEIEIKSPEQVNVRCIVTWNSDHHKVTLNLLAPLIINSENQNAKQVVLQNVPYNTRHLLWANNKDNPEGGEG